MKSPTCTYAGRMCPEGFLSPLAEDARTPHVLRNLRHGRVVASRVETAFDSAGRKKGLLGRSSMDSGTALILAPCSAVHTFFMRFPIDAAFVTRAGRVAKIYRNLPAWRLAGCLGAYGVIELAAGALDLSDTRCGDSLVAEPVPPSPHPLQCSGDDAAMTLQWKGGHA